MKKFGCIAIAVIAVVICGLVFINSIRQSQAKAPDTAFMVTTSSRVYLSDNVTEDNGVFTLHNYYEKVGNRWQLEERDLILDTKTFGKVTVRSSTE